MAKRFGRTLISRPAAHAYGYKAAITGSDSARLSGDCESPVTIEFTGLQDKILSRLSDWSLGHSDYAEGHGFTEAFPDTPRVQHVDVRVRCRKCFACRRARAAQWRIRTRTEILSSERAWFGTLTLNPENRFRMEAQARARLRAAGTKWEQLTNDECYSETCKQVTKVWQLYMKRLRKHAAGLRFVAVFERHKDGTPHMHAVICETLEPIRHRQLDGQWPLGFTKWNLVPEGDGAHAASYVAKYLSKNSPHKILASKHWGREASP